MMDIVKAGIAAGFIFCIAFGLFRYLAVCKRKRFDPMDEMEGRDFELFCARLLEKNGVTYAIQCKRYTAPVGIKAIQEAYAGRDYYDRMVGAVLTNEYFTTPAVKAAQKLKILLWDRGYLEEMMENDM